MKRRAIIKNQKMGDKATVAQYLPSNYEVTASNENYILIEGQDNAGWTLDEYVIPRLQSGLIFAEELPAHDDGLTWDEVRSFLIGE